jgi:hypothetical protein
MNDTSRRKFLAAAGAGAAGVAVAGVISATPAGAKTVSATPTALPPDAEGALVAYVSDVTTSQVHLLVGEHEVVVHDSELVARLARAAGK